MPKPGRTYIRRYVGADEHEIDQEPSWKSGHNHRVGFLNKHGLFAGLTHEQEEEEEEQEEQDQKFTEQAIGKLNDLKRKTTQGELVNFQDLMRDQSHFRRERPQVFPPGWRFMVLGTEDWVKNKQEWPANIKAREKKEAQKKQEQEEEQERESERQDDEDDWRRSNSSKNAKHHGAYGGSGQDRNGDPHNNEGDSKDEQQAQTNGETAVTPKKTHYQKMREKYTPQEITLLQHLQHESTYIHALKRNGGKNISPMKERSETVALDIDIADAMTPDNWIPRNKTLQRLTGPHPLNAEPDLSTLFNAGLITPNSLHYVRNHGAVPRLYWETHILEVENGKLKLKMDELRDRFDPINIPVALACDGNRRGELNMVKKSKGFTWGSGACSCAYWKGARLGDVLEAAGVERPSEECAQRMWVNFEGADEPSEGKYATSIPLEYAMSRENDVILAYEMNNVPLPPDHGYPVRLMIPGWVGGRCIKWLAKIWVSEKENDSYYHIWDNRVLPSFITEKDGDFARTMFHHPSTACNEQNLNSVIVKPAQSEKIKISEILKKDTYRVEGLAYDGAGHEVQRVELSLDEGETWLYCVRQYPDEPVRHGNKFWSWLFWHIDIDTAHFIEAKSLTVRCFNVFKNTQPEHFVWNTMGMMNNAWHKVKLTLEEGQTLLARHPVDIQGNDGWMKPSTENQLAAAKQDSGVPDKQFTRQNVEEHSTQDDPWLVINNKVYDVKSVLEWHPGGKASILAYIGKLTAEATSSFESIHDEYAHKKLNECIIGRLTDKATKFITEQAKAAAEEAAKSSNSKEKVLLQKQSWTEVILKDRKQISSDTFTYTFAIPSNKAFNLNTCQHIQFAFHMKDKMLIRSYTPTRPISSQNAKAAAQTDQTNTFDLTIKTYFPTSEQPGGAFTNLLYELPLGSRLDVNGPTGEIIYLGRGKFSIEGSEMHFDKVSLILGGSGVTPGYALIERVLSDPQDTTRLRVVDSNKSAQDILMRAQLDQHVKQQQEKRTGDGETQFEVVHVLSHAAEDLQWDSSVSGKLVKGHVNADIIRENCFAPQDDAETEGGKAVVFLCGPPGMILKAAMPALRDWGYEEEKNCFGF